MREERVYVGIKVADLVFRKRLEVKQGERILIVADDASMVENREVISAFIGVARSIGATTCLVVIPNFEGKPNVPDSAIKALEGADVVIPFTLTSQLFARDPGFDKLLEQKKFRYIGFHQRGWDDINSPYMKDLDVESMNELAHNIMDALKDKHDVRVTSKIGTNLTCKVHEWLSRSEKDFGWGEVSNAPVEGTAEGVVVIDGPIGAGIGVPSEPLRMTIKNGRVADFSGGGSARIRLQNFLTIRDADNIGELSMGTNPLAKRSGNISQDMKVMGTMHIALGNGYAHGQKNDSPIHVDCVMYEPTLVVDGITVIEDGKQMIRRD